MPKLTKHLSLPRITLLPSKPNPYREILRKRFSEPLLLLLIFVFGVWLWDNHLGKPAGYPPDAWEIAMLKADRDLRLAEATADFPSWSRPLLGIDHPDQAVRGAIASFRELHRGSNRSGEARDIDLEGAYALSVLIALEKNAHASNAPFRQFGLQRGPLPGPILSRVIEGKEYWWDLAYLRDLELPEAAFAKKLSDARTQHLLNNTLKARGFVIALALGGLVFIPGTLLAFVRGREPKRPVNITHHWPLAFSLGVFLLSYLAQMGFGLTLNQVLEIIAARSNGSEKFLLSPGTYILLDSLTRFLAPLIAFSFLFRRVRHAISRFGLAGPLNGRMVLGCFSILQIIEFGLRTTLDRTGKVDPMGGLSSSEAGAWGLALGIASACIAAPIAEEILYRGVLFRSLANRLKLGVAVTVSSVVFAIVHLAGIPGLIMIGAVGALCALSYRASATLLTAIVLHALYNAAIKIPEWIIYHAPLS